MTGPAPDVPPPRFDLTDVGNAQRFVYYHGADVHWVDPWDTWLVWDGHRWRQDDTLAAVRCAKDTVHRIWQSLAEAAPDERPLLGKWWIKSASKYGLDAMLQVAKSEPGIAIPIDALDRSPWLLNVANGTLDLRTGELGPPCRDDLLTKRVDIAYDPAATCPAWELFLMQIFDGDLALIDYVQRAIGYSLTGDMREECLFFLYGSGANGKSTLLEIIGALTGDYGMTADFATFVEQRGGGGGGSGPSGDRARLLGARYVRASEMREGERMNEAVIKSMTSPDKQVARHMHKSEFEFYYTHKLWLASNHKPVIRGTDHAIWRRMRLIPFTVTIQPEHMDAGLRDKLRAELPGILNTAVEACQRWLEQGLRAPESVQAATAQYRAESDSLAEYLDDNCWTNEQRAAQMLANATGENGNGVSSTGEGHSDHSNNAPLIAPAKDLYAVYQGWALQRGERAMTQTAFGRRLEERGYSAEKIKRVTYRHGLTIRDDVEVPSKGRGLFDSDTRSS